MKGPHCGENYPQFFRESMIRYAERSLEDVKDARSVLSDAMRVQALHVLSFALKWTEAWPIAKDLLLAIAPKMEQAGYRDDWMLYLERGIEQSRLQKCWQTEAEFLFYQGILLTAMAQYEKATNTLLSSLHLAEKNDLTTIANIPSISKMSFQHKKAKTLNRLAHVAYEQENFSKSSWYARQALELLPKSDAECAYSYAMLGHAAQAAHESSGAVRYFENALILRRTEGNRRMISSNLRNLGIVYKNWGKYDKAIQLYQEVIRMHTEEEDPILYAATIMNLGNIYVATERFDEALNTYATVEPIFQRYNDNSQLAMLYTNRGIALRSMACWHKAEQSLLMSIELSRQVKKYRLLINAYDALSIVYIKQKVLSKASGAIDDASSYLDYIEDSKVRNKMSKMLEARLQEIAEA